MTFMTHFAVDEKGNAASTAIQFLADADGNHDHPPPEAGLAELGFFSRGMRILGVYPGAISGPRRRSGA